MNFPTSTRLDLSRSVILERWEALSRECIKSTEGKDTVTVLNEMTHFLHALSVNLKLERTNVTPNEDDSARNHGQQRSGLTRYELPEIIKEYSLLRKVIIEVLTESGPLSELEREIIHSAIDNAIQVASNEFNQAEKARLKLALAKANSSNRDLEQFAAVTAHDLKSPLMTMSGFSELLREDLEGIASSESLEHLDYILSATRRMSGLIDGILNFARLNSSSEEFSIIESKDAVGAAVQNLKGPLTESSGRVAHEHLPQVTGSLPLITQLFQNLIANALKFRSEEPPMIDIFAESDGGDWIFSVKDNGVGFDPQFKESIFEVYKQLETDRKVEGTGLGLASCRRVVEMHGGSIWADSELGVGSVFYFKLPKIQSQ